MSKLRHLLIIKHLFYKNNFSIYFNALRYVQYRKIINNNPANKKKSIIHYRQNMAKNVQVTKENFECTLNQNYQRCVAKKKKKTNPTQVKSNKIITKFFVNLI